MNYLVARVSDVSQRKALPAQKKQLMEYASTLGWRVNIDCKYVEFDETAYHDSRKKFWELVIQPLQKEKELVIVVMHKIDRYSRDSSSEEKAALTKLWKQGRIEMHFPGDNLFINKNSPAADLFRLDIGIALAGYYSSAIRDNIRRRFDQMISDGIWVSSSPLGYLNYIKGKDDKGNILKDIRLDDGRWQHIVEGFKLRATGLSFAAIAQNRCDAGFTTKKGGYVSQAKWAEILINPFYAGRMIYLGKEYPHKYDVIIEPWLWEKVQQVNRERNKSHTKYNAKPYLLKKLRCAECGCTVSFEGPKSKGQLIYGKCTASSRQHKPSYVNESLLLEQIREKLKSITIPKQVLPEIINGIYKYNENQKDFYIKRSKELNIEYEELEFELKELFADRKQFKSRPDILESLIQTKVSRQKTIQQELSNYEDGNKSYLKASIFLVDVCSRIPELFNSEYRSIEQRRYLLDFVFQNMVLNEKSLVLPLKQPLRILVDKINTSDWCRV